MRYQIGTRLNAQGVFLAGPSPCFTAQWLVNRAMRSVFRPLAGVPARNGLDEEALRLSLISGDWVERLVLEGFFEVSDGGLRGSLAAIASGLFWRRAKRCKLRSNGRLGQ